MTITKSGRRCWLQTPEGYFVDVTHTENARIRAQRRAWLFQWIALGLAVGLVYAGLRGLHDKGCTAPVMQLESETIRSSPNPGVWL